MDMDINSILDSTLDDLEDLPEFGVFPPGAHRVLCTLELKEINDKQCVESSFKYVENVELADPQSEAPNEGSIANILCTLDNEFGRGMLKKIATPIAGALGTTSTRETIEQANDIEVVIVTGYKKNKEDPTSPYMKLIEIGVV